MFKASRRVLSLLAVMVAVGGLAAASAQAARVPVNGERATITFNAVSLGFFSQFGITTTATGPATGGDGVFTFPITHGWVTNEGPPMAEINSSGGITFSTAHRTLRFRDFVAVQKDDQVWLRALLNDRGWVNFAVVSPITRTPVGNEVSINGELKMTQQNAEAFDWLVDTPGAVPVGIDIGKVAATVRFG